MKTFTHGNFKITIKRIGGKLWFVGKDVAESLGYKRPCGAIANHVHNDDKITAKTPRGSRWE